MNGVVGAIMFLPYYQNGTLLTPINWLQCNGLVLPIQPYQLLYSVLGTQYGGDGIMNFRIPKIDSFIDASSGKAINAWICYQGTLPTFVK